MTTKKTSSLIGVRAQFLDNPQKKLLGDLGLQGGDVDDMLFLPRPEYFWDTGF